MVTSSRVTARLVPTIRPGPPALLDVALALIALGVTLSQVAHGGVTPVPPRPGELDLIGGILAACSTVPLIVWRRFPLGVFVATAVAGVLLAGLGYPLDLLLGPAVALYLLAGSRKREAPWTWSTTAIVVGLFAAYLGAIAVVRASFPGAELLHTGLAWAAAWFAGERSRLRREHLDELKDRAARIERDAERERMLAVAQERARIARDLHDSAGHAINVIAVRAGAARLRHDQEPDRSLLALKAIEEVARRTSEEIDHIVGALREGAANRVEAPAGLASLDTLIAHHVDVGLEVTSETTGVPRPLGAAADQGAYRILQEALTNAARHGAGNARIEVAFGGAAVELTVANPVPADRPPPSGRGHGLIGMRERVSLLGGTLDAEHDDRTFRVHAQIPYGGRHT